MINRFFYRSFKVEVHCMKRKFKVKFSNKLHGLKTLPKRFVITDHKDNKLLFKI